MPEGQLVQLVVQLQGFLLPQWGQAMPFVQDYVGRTGERRDEEGSTEGLRAGQEIEARVKSRAQCEEAVRQ